MPHPVRRLLLPAFLLLLLVGGFFLAKLNHPATLPPGIVSGNGRLEATEVDIAAKVGGRLSHVNAREGDDVVSGKIVAELDAEDLKAQLRAAEAQVVQALKIVDEARSSARKSHTDLILAQKTVRRSRELVGRGFIANDKLDRDQTAAEGAAASLAQARSRIAEAEAAVTTAQARAESLKATVDDTTLKSSIAGRVLYRLAQPGEVLPAGGKVLTLLDLADVYLSIYLPAGDAGKIVLGDPARIVLDALPEQPLPAKVVFVAPRSQFTPKEVETRNEREKLMYRVKLQVAPEWLARHADLAKPGMPGMGYVRTQPDAVWPIGLTLR